MPEARKFSEDGAWLTVGLALLSVAGLGLFVPTETRAAEHQAALILPEADLPARLESRWMQGSRAITSWPVPIGALCPGEKSPESASSDSSMDDPECDGRHNPLHLTLNAGFYGLERRYPLGDSFEVFRPGWESHRVSAELGGVWNRLPPALNLEFNYSFSSAAHFYVRGGLRRDLSAWHDDPLAANWPLSEKEVDLNQPMLGYFHAENGWGAATLGRFPVHWSPSPEYGLALSREVPYHNGLLVALKLEKLRYLFLVSSLNPWLEGSPQGDSSGTGYPPGSEEWQQRHYGGTLNDNAHLRVYDDRIKTLIAHRLELPWGPLQLGLTEVCVIGGKVPDFRDVNPFGVYHNDFKDGFENTAVSADAKLRLPAGFGLLGEAIVDAVNYTTEPEAKNVDGFMAAVEHSWPARAFTLLQSLHVIRTDPLLYRYLQPYNTLYSRMILTSNNQNPHANPFVDKYVVDYPLGYARGGGALDTRYAARIFSGKTQGLLRLEYLTNEGASLEIPFDSLVHGRGLSPYQTEEWRALLSAERRLGRGFSLQGGLGQDYVIFPARRPRTASHFQANLGVSWTWP